MILLITGPMFSSKSTELFKYLEKDHYAKRKFCLLRPKKDRDYFSHSEAIDLSYNNLKIETFLVNKIEDTFITFLSKYESIYIDEAFMIEDIYKVAEILGPDREIYIASLLASSENKVFDEIIKLLPFCDDIVKLNAVCTCGSKQANYTYYKMGKKTEAIVLGDKEYEPKCQKCLQEIQWFDS